MVPIQNRGSIATAVSVLPTLASKLATCLPFTFIGAMCVPLMAALIAEEAKCWFLPPTHICGFINRKQMKNKRAAGILGNHGALTKPTKRRQRLGVWRLLVKDLSIAKGQVLKFAVGFLVGNVGGGEEEVF